MIYHSVAIEEERKDMMARHSASCTSTSSATSRRMTNTAPSLGTTLPGLTNRLRITAATYDWSSDFDQTVIDYIASMTDGYFIELACTLFPELDFPQRTYINE